MVTCNLHREYLLFVAFLRLCLVVAKHKDVTPCRVTVEVAEKEDVSTLQRALHHQLRVVVDWIELA